MNKDYPLMPLMQPQSAARRKEKPPRPELPPEKLANRQRIAQALIPQVSKLSSELQTMSEEQRKAIIIKLQHERPVSLDGTDLKLIADSEFFTLATPRTDNLNKFSKKIDDFGTGDLKKGHVPNEGLAYLNTIQKAMPKDRLSQELFDRHDELIKQDWVICEIEMLSLVNGKHKQRVELQQIRSDLQRLFTQGGGGALFEHEELKGTCRAVIRCTGKIFKQLVENREWQTKIVWFDARPEFETFHTTLKDFNINSLGDFSSPDLNAPIVCIVDSGVTCGNPFLKPVVRENLVRSFLRGSPDEPEDRHGHGSGIASLAAYYALNIETSAENEGRVWIASARILNENNQLEDLDSSPETELRLFSKVLTEIVETFVPLGIKIFNLSVGILNQKWNVSSKRTVPRRSWIARTIDRLSREHDVLFVVSTGNILPLAVRSLYENNEPYPKYFLNEDAAILDPSQSALALTVGSVVPTTLAVGSVANAMAIAEKNHPSPFTRCGPGINKEIKPELVDFGGNYLIDEGGQVRLNPGTNVIMASHQATPAIAHNSGTSFATPRVAYKIARVLESLQTLDIENVSAPLLKAFIVNSASYDFLNTDFKTFTESMDTEQGKSWLNILGYGMSDHNKATSCDLYSAILFFQGEISPDTVMYFDIPVPKCFVDTGKTIKRLTVTVVHAPRVQRWGLERYLGTTLKWKMFRGNIPRNEIIEAMSAEETEEEDENATPVKPTELKFKLGVNRRSRGTVQHDVHEWSIHQTEYSSSSYTLAIAAYGKWNKKKADPDPLAIVVRIEDTSGTVPVYTEVRNLLEVEVET
jgi:Subtilase family